MTDERKPEQLGNSVSETSEVVAEDLAANLVILSLSEERFPDGVIGALQRLQQHSRTVTAAAMGIGANTPGAIVFAYEPDLILFKRELPEMLSLEVVRVAMERFGETDPDTGQRLLDPLFVEAFQEHFDAEITELGEGTGIDQAWETYLGESSSELTSRPEEQEPQGEEWDETKLLSQDQTKLYSGFDSPAELEKKLREYSVYYEEFLSIRHDKGMEYLDEIGLQAGGILATDGTDDAIADEALTAAMDDKWGDARGWRNTASTDEAKMAIDVILDDLAREKAEEAITNGFWSEASRCMANCSSETAREQVHQVLDLAIFARCKADAIAGRWQNANRWASCASNSKIRNANHRAIEHIMLEGMLEAMDDEELDKVQTIITSLTSADARDAFSRAARLHWQ